MLALVQSVSYPILHHNKTQSPMKKKVALGNFTCSLYSQKHHIILKNRKAPLFKRIWYHLKEFSSIFYDCRSGCDIKKKRQQVEKRNTVTVFTLLRVAWKSYNRQHFNNLYLVKKVFLDLSFAIDSHSLLSSVFTVTQQVSRPLSVSLPAAVSRWLCCLSLST